MALGKQRRHSPSAHSGLLESMQPEKEQLAATWAPELKLSAFESMQLPIHPGSVVVRQTAPGGEAEK
jgi:hypothetical protein